MQPQFWRLIATAINSAEASLTVGVAVPVGARWFRHAGGMPPTSLAEPTGHYLSFAEREEIALLRGAQVGVREIARRIDCGPGTISRELRRNAAMHGGLREYPALVTQWKAQQAAREDGEAGDQRPVVWVPPGTTGRQRSQAGRHRTIIVGPEPLAWKGLNKPHRRFM